MDKLLKHKLVEELQGVFQDTNIVIVTQNVGLTVKDSKNLRRNVAKVNSSYRVAKNRLVKIALKGTKYEGLTDLMSGPTAISYSNDPVAIAKALHDFAKGNEKLKITGGIMGETVLSPAQIKQLADLPSLDQLRGKLIGLIQAPATKIAGVLQAPAGQLARLVDAKSKKN